MNKYLLKAALCMLLALLVSSVTFAVSVPRKDSNNVVHNVIHNYSDKIWFVTGKGDPSISFRNCQHYLDQKRYCGIAPHGEVGIDYSIYGGRWDGSGSAEGTVTLKNQSGVSYTFEYGLANNNMTSYIYIFFLSDETNAITINQPTDGSFTINAN